MERYICIHGHFYQPPRENPWLEAIELQDSAYPYHDWNDRITAECYAPNAASRIMHEEKWIARIINNYAKISFNFGPTLLAWLKDKVPDLYGSILDADRESMEAFAGHGSAMAQAYNHMILPLANRRDKYTQVLWGIRDFEHRFGRSPEGMWLPETAVDLETLDIMADQGIRFTVLAPSQASRVRAAGGENWRDVSGARIDPTMPYELHLPSKRRIALFFYDGPVSRAVAFEGLLRQGESFAERIAGGFSKDRTWPQLMHIATDGETYGHHHRFGEMALSYALHFIESKKLARVINYGEYLEKHPPSHEVEIFESTSWSCAHGIERWRSDCGCNSGRAGWNQEWREPLRAALDWLRDTLAPAYEEKARPLLKDPWAARDDYIDVILDRSPERIESFFEKHATHDPDEGEKLTALKLLELQRHAMLMYTSCGWFFDELSGIETVQVIRYAGRAIQLAQEVIGDSIEPRFLELLEAAKSNIPEHGDGRRIYEKFVRPAMVDLAKVGAHYAVSSLFEEYAERTSIYCYTADREAYRVFDAGKTRLAVGKARFTSDITRESAVLTFGVLHFGDHNLNCGVGDYQGEEKLEALVQEVSGTFARADFLEIIRILDRHFRTSTYSLKSLFRDEQRRVLGMILEPTLLETETAYRQLYERYAPLLRFLKDSGVPPPRALSIALEFSLNASLRRAFEGEELDFPVIEPLLEEARTLDVALDAATLEFAVRRSIERMAQRLFDRPNELPLLRRLETAVRLAQALPFEVNLWKVQNVCYDLFTRAYPDFRKRAAEGNEQAQEWVQHFTALGERLRVRVPQ